MKRQTLLSLFSIALLAAMALAPVTEAQQDDNRPQDGQRQRGGDRGGRGGRGFGGGGVATLGLLRIDEVRKEINMTEDQQELVEILGEELREGRPDFPQNFREMSEDERTAFTEKMQKWNDEQSAQARDTLKTILDEKQYARLNQIVIQTQGVNALTEAEVAKTLKLSDEQQKKLKETQEASQEEARAAMREAFQGGGRGLDRDAVREKLDTARKQTEEKMLAHLTAEQKAQFEAMKGEKFDMPEFGRGGGRPGFGGRGRGDGEGRPEGDRPRRPE